MIVVSATFRLKQATEEEINQANYREVYSKMGLKDLTGINVGNERRLNRFGIHSVLDFCDAEVRRLRAAFGGISGYYWYMRLRGWEIDDVEFSRRSFGNSYALPHSNGSLEELLPILQKLVEKTGSRLRRHNYKACGVHVGLSFKDGSFWHRSRKYPQEFFDSRDIYRKCVEIMRSCPEIKPVRILAESVFEISDIGMMQMSLLEDLTKKRKLIDAVDEINDRWGDFVVTPARMILAGDKVQDRISFGGVKELS